MATLDHGLSDGSGLSQQPTRNIDLSVACWNRFLTRDLVIVPDLVGLAHEFIYEQNTVRISLPSKGHLPKDPLKGELLTFSCYRQEKEGIVPLEFEVHAVDVVVAILGHLSLPEEILNRNPNACEILEGATQKRLDRLAGTYKSVAEKAFDHWIRILRWKCDNSTIGRPAISGHRSGWGSYLVAEPTGKRIWAWHETIVLNRSKAVTAEGWRASGLALQDGILPPVYVELIFDATEHMKLGDLQRATVDMAVACETFLRMLVSNSLPGQLSESITEYIDDANIRTVLSKFVPEILDEHQREQFRMIENSLHQLFNARNDIVHKGLAANLKPNGCQRFLEVTRKLIDLGNYGPTRRNRVVACNDTSPSIE